MTREKGNQNVEGSDQGLTRGNDLALENKPHECRMLGRGSGTGYREWIGLRSQAPLGQKSDKGNQNVEESEQGVVREWLQGMT